MFSFSQSITNWIFQGNKKYSGDDLKSLVDAEKKKYIETSDISYIDDASFVILSYYRNEGHFFAYVDYEIEDSRVIFQIKEYNQVLVKEISIVSEIENKKLSFKIEDLEKFLTKPSLLSKHYFNKAQISSDKGSLDAFYVNEGYLEQKSLLKYHFSPEKPNSTEVIIEVAINEGPRFYLDKVEFYGNSAFSEEKLKNILKFNESKVYFPRLHQNLSDILKDFYRENGYAKVKITTEVNDIEQSRSNERVGRQVLFNIKEDEKNYVRDISIQGNEFTRNYVIFRQMDISKGDLYNIAKIRSSQQNLNDTKLFVWIEVEEKFVGNNQVDLLFSVKERNNKSLTFNLGYDTTYGVTGGAVFEHINIFGSNKRFLFSVDSTIVPAELSKSEVSSILFEPQLLGSSVWSGQLKAFALYEETPSYIVFDRGTGIQAENKISRNLTLQLGYNITWSQILDVEPGVEEEEGTTFLSTLHQKLIFNFRDNDGYPTSGSYHFIEFEESLTAIGADVDYLKFYLHNAWYFDIGGICVLSFAVRGGVIFPFGGSDKVPIQKRFFSGGAESVRSYKTKQMPPWNEKDLPIGGEGIFLASTEIRIPIYGSVGMSLFADTGQLMLEVRDFEDYRISKLNHAVGASLWYNTPIGPIRVDFGINPDRKTNPLTGTKEDMFAWYISIGFSF